MEEVAWYRQLGAAVCNKVMGSSDSQNESKRTSEDERQWQRFELFDAMEQGLAKVLTTSYIEPPKRKSPEQRVAPELRLLVRRSIDRKSFTLLSKCNDPLLVAFSNEDGTHFDICIPNNGDPPCAFGPAFSLSCNSSKDKWTLNSDRCENCEWRAKRQCGTRRLALFSHYKELVGGGEALCMDVSIPEVTENIDKNTVWCSVCGDGVEQCKTQLTSRRPRWNAREKSLMMDFAGRCSMASTKNFQLEMTGDDGGRQQGKKVTHLLFGKTHDNEFVLDYKAPLGMVQAFASALTAQHLK